MIRHDDMSLILLRTVNVYIYVGDFILNSLLKMSIDITLQN